ncbi:MAG: hypothetical protein P8Y52_03195 [Xanthomonadales bacterium]
MDDTAFYRILVAVETDATRYYGADAQRPAVLSTADAEQMLAHVSADLRTLLPDITGCSLIAAGAVYDQVQILRPGFPVFRALEAVVRDDDRAPGDADPFRAGLVSVGGRDGILPDPDLQPLGGVPLGLMQLLPIVVHGPVARVRELGQAMEYRFLEEGQVSAHSAAWLESAFDIRIRHARFMTLTDLNAMLRMQLEHFGFLPLWELLDGALNGRDTPLAVKGNMGQRFELRDAAVRAEFQSFDHWANRGAGTGTPAARQHLAAAYADWTREVRQYATTLAAHGLPVRFHLPGRTEPLDGSWFREAGTRQAGTLDAAVTEHSYGDLGTIAVTVVHDGRSDNYYPLTAQGLNDIHDHLRARIPDKHTVAFPGTVLYDERNRCLVADTYRPQNGPA